MAELPETAIPRFWLHRSLQPEHLEAPMHLPQNFTTRAGCNRPVTVFLSKAALFLAPVTHPLTGHHCLEPALQYLTMCSGSFLKFRFLAFRREAPR
ncbi:hypothetical protein, partial [Rubidibacter lacunae]